jgi:hypothetical protein
MPVQSSRVTAFDALPNFYGLPEPKLARRWNMDWARAAGLLGYLFNQIAAYGEGLEEDSPSRYRRGFSCSCRIVFLRSLAWHSIGQHTSRALRERVVE